MAKVSILRIRDPATGEIKDIKAIKGKDGIGITEAKINVNNELILVYSDGRVENLGNIKGDAYEVTSDDYVEIAEDILKTDVIKKVIADSEDAISLAKQCNYAKGYDDYESLIAELNTTEAKVFNVGQSFLIETLNVPDLWVKTVGETSEPYLYVDDAALVEELLETGHIQIGYYTLSILETLKQDLTNYVKFDNTSMVVKQGITSNDIILTNDEQNSAKSWLGINDLHVINADEIIKIWDLDAGLYLVKKGATVYSRLALPSDYDDYILLVHHNQVFYKTFVAIVGNGSVPQLLFGWVAESYGEHTIIGLNSISNKDVNENVYGVKTFFKTPINNGELADDDKSKNIPTTEWVNRATTNIVNNTLVDYYDKNVVNTLLEYYKINHTALNIPLGNNLIIDTDTQVWRNGVHFDFPNDKTIQHINYVAINNANTLDITKKYCMVIKLNISSEGDMTSALKVNGYWKNDDGEGTIDGHSYGLNTGENYILRVIQPNADYEKLGIFMNWDSYAVKSDGTFPKVATQLLDVMLFEMVDLSYDITGLKDWKVPTLDISGAITIHKKLPSFPYCIINGKGNIGGAWAMPLTNNVGNVDIVFGDKLVDSFVDKTSFEEHKDALENYKTEIDEKFEKIQNGGTPSTPSVDDTNKGKFKRWAAAGTVFALKPNREYKLLCGSESIKFYYDSNCTSPVIDGDGNELPAFKTAMVDMVKNIDVYNGAEYHVNLVMYATSIMSGGASSKMFRISANSPTIYAKSTSGNVNYYETIF